MFMELPVSGLHRLFHAAPSNITLRPARTQSSLESVTDDAHTYDLLYPEPSALRQPQNHAYPLKHRDPSVAAQAATSHDDRGGLDIQCPRDVRILIAQDGNALTQQPCVLYDSQPTPSSSLLRQGGLAEAVNADTQPEDLRGAGIKRHHTSGPDPQPAHRAWPARGSAFGFSTQSQLTSPTSPDPPETEFRGAFSNPRLRRSGTRPASSGGESAQSKLARERREETEALLGCMFGSTGLPLVSTTKFHVKPARPVDVVGTGGLASLTSAEARIFPKRRTPLTRSTTTDDLHSLPPTLSEDGNVIGSSLDSPSMLITRIFSVDFAESIANTHNMAPRTSNKEPATASAKIDPSHQPTALAENDSAKQVKTPTYAVALVLQLPADRPRCATTSSQEPRSTNLSSHPSQFPTPAPSLPWAETAHNDGSGCSDRDVEILLDHWNMLNRVVSSLETIAREKIRELLVDLEARIATLQTQILMNDGMKSPYQKQKRSKLPSQRTVQLPPEALQQCDLISRQAEMAEHRVALALRIRRVIAGQGRWGIWREEARWVGKWAGSREQNFFFFNVITAFLGTHTEWLDSLGLNWYRRRRTRQNPKPQQDVNVMRHRTVIISSDKMAARRLIFLLSAFLPVSRTSPVHEDGNRPQSPRSNVCYSQSPPSGISLLRQQSLRRTIKLRQRGVRPSINTKLHDRGVSFSSQDLETSPSAIITMSNRHHRPSDARSIQSLPLPISPNGGLTRKSSTATTATAIPETAIPVPHFSNNLSPDLLLGTSAEARPGSSGSFASLSLKHTLTRSGSTDRSNGSADSQSISRWGSMISGFWSTRRASSTDGSDAPPSSQEGLGTGWVSKERRGSRPVGRLAQMMEEAEKLPENRPLLHEDIRSIRASNGPTSVPPQEGVMCSSVDQSTPARNIPARPKIEQFPMKLSVDENDGVVDVELPMPNSFSSSFASSMSSPKATHTGASSFNDSSLYGRTCSQNINAAGSISPVDVAGWLKSYHEDFALQAVRPYDGLEEDIKRSMYAEPVQMVASSMSQDFKSSQCPWAEVCTTLIANAQDFSVHRLTLRQRPALAPGLHSHSPSLAMEKEIISEPIMDIDATLIDAVERVLAQSTHSSRTHSRTVSPSRTPDVPRGLDSHILEVPRSECRRLVLGALEQIVKSVSEELDGRGRAFDGKGTGERVIESTLREGVKRWLSGAAEG